MAKGTRAKSVPGYYTKSSAITSNPGQLKSSTKTGNMPDVELKANKAKTKRKMRSNVKAAKTAADSRLAGKAAMKAGAKTALKEVAKKAVPFVGAALTAKEVTDVIMNESRKSKSGATGRGRSKAKK